MEADSGAEEVSPVAAVSPAAVLAGADFPAEAAALAAAGPAAAGKQQ